MDRIIIIGSGMRLAYQKTVTQVKKPWVSMLWCARCTPELFRASSERECTLWLVRETALFVLALHHYHKTPTKCICIDSGEFTEHMYDVYLQL